MSSIGLLLVLQPLLFHLVQGAENECGEGWVYHDKLCFTFRNEYETFGTATQSCEMLGGFLAYATDQEMLDFLTAQIKLKSNYGWWYGIQIDGFSKRVKIQQEYEMSFSFFRPKTKQLIEPTKGCVAILIDEYFSDYIFISTPCKVKLPYACRGERSLLPHSVLKDDEHIVVASSSDVYWFSDVLDKRTYQDAQKACIEKSMTLISIRDETASENITSEIYSRQDDSIDPWWIGLSVTDGEYSWTSGVELQSSVLKWKRLTDDYGDELTCRILLEEGTMDLRECYASRAPFICVRYPAYTGKFGCQPFWVRAGQSCYYYGRSNNTWITHAEAHNLCAKFDSHLVSVDTLEEKIWLLDSSIFETNSFRNIWTSLNDKKTLNDFRWADGSKPSKNLVDITSRFHKLRYGKCFIYSPDENELSRLECEYNAFPGCQYKSHNGQCVSKYWKFLNGNCYYVVKYDYHNYNDTTSKYVTDPGPYHATLKTCYDTVVKYDSSIIVQPLKLDSKAVIKLFSEIQYIDLFTGLTETDKGVYKWADGSKADMSLFDEKTTRKDDSSRRCTSMDDEGSFVLQDCDSDRSPRALCEKETPYHHTG